MAKVFTITPGLENMGAMKTGGQGSVYKGRRIGEITTAIKLLPTPIYNESDDDKNYRNFKNEVQKLYKVNEVPNPNVVKILSSGLSETGNFPFIEMDYIEGPDLEELLKPPHDPVFTIKEVLKVAEHLSNALAHCHQADVKHGDIKSNNVKYNRHTGNYVLLDFGLAAMSDEQRRTSLRHAGAVEFMAPEQNEGEMLFETDVYSFGVIMFELLAGGVPFPLNDKGETARNVIRLQHIETAPPGIIPLRLEALPQTWPVDKRSREMQVPQWLLKMTYKCLEKKPENRFRNGGELYNFVIYNITNAAGAAHVGESGGLAKTPGEKEYPQQQLAQYKQQLAEKEKEILTLKAMVNNNADASLNTAAYSNNTSAQAGVSKGSFITLLIITLGLAAFSAYTYFYAGKNKSNLTDEAVATMDTTNSQVPDDQNTIVEKREDTIPKKQKRTVTVPKIDSTGTGENMPLSKSIPKQPEEDTAATARDYIIPSTPTETVTQEKPADQYKVAVKAYFYTSPDESTKRNAYMVPSDNAVLKALDDQNGFIYIVFTNQLGKISKGWLRKQDLNKVSE